MGFTSTFLGILGCWIGLPIGLLIGFYFFIYSKPEDVKDPKIRPLYELDIDTLQNLIPEIPLWVKNPDYDRVDWLNTFILDMWPFLDKAICSNIKSTCEPMFAEYIGQYKVEKIEFDSLTLGTLPPTIQGLKVYETNEKELVLEPAIKWAGNSNIVVSIVLLSARIRVQVSKNERLDLSGKNVLNIDAVSVK
nr:synaptotagmin-3 isoform X1 [Ipomoea batatas]